MDIPDKLHILYTTPILTPGYVLKIKLHAQENSELLNYLLENSKSVNMLGIVPGIDYGKVDDVIGTVGHVQSLIKFDSAPEEFFILVQGICRFKLDETIRIEQFQISKIIIIENFKELIGDEKEINELRGEFKKALNDMLTYSDLGVKSTFITTRLKTHLKEIPLHQTIEYCLKIIRLTQADFYDILRATNLNILLKFVIYLLKRETIRNAKFDKSELIPMPITGFKQSVIKRNNLPELNEILAVIQNSSIPTSVIDLIMKEFKNLEAIPSSNSDYSVLLNYLNFVVHLPWNKSTKETLDLGKARSILQLNHYGMDSVKTRIIQFIAVRLLNPQRRGPILCFVGPPGVGKTSIAKAIATSLNRTYKRISLGGINCYSDIKGHRKTYIGAMAGLIIQAINQAQTNNPVILLDEIDKMYYGGNGNPAAALLEVLDPEQNSSFVDSYVNLPFDLSQVLFIATANNASYIPPTLSDRMEIIYLDGYAIDEKIQIAKNYLIPKIQKDYNMNEVQISIPSDTINYIIQNYTFEAGVRELQRKLETIYHYIAVDVVENADKKKESYMITPESLLEMFGIEDYPVKNALVKQCYNRVGVAIGLSWTPSGGIIQVVETSKLHSKNPLILTGLAGQTLKESVEIALNWIQSLAEKPLFPPITLRSVTAIIHLCFPNSIQYQLNNIQSPLFPLLKVIGLDKIKGGQKKDGPSAGITVVCALISLFWNVPLRPMIAMTGELSLTGYVLPVGGVKDKILAAYNSDIKTVIIPEDNFTFTIDSLPQYVKDNVTIIPVKHVTEVLDIVVPGGLEFLQKPTSVMPVSKI